MEYKLRLSDDPILREISIPVEEDEDLSDLIVAMYKIMKENKGIGISAVQVGVPKRLVIVSGEDGNHIVMVNPSILIEYGEQTVREGCLSFPGVYVTKDRPTRLKVSYRDRTWKEQTLSVRDPLLAQCIKHELEHLSAILLTDKESS